MTAVFLVVVLLAFPCGMHNAVLPVGAASVDTDGVFVEVLNEINNLLKDVDAFLHTPAGEELLSEVLPPLMKLIEDVDELGQEVQETIKQLLSQLMPNIPALLQLAKNQKWEEVTETLKESLNKIDLTKVEQMMVTTLFSDDSTALAKMLGDLAEINSSLNHFSESGGLLKLYAAVQPSLSALLEKVDLLGIGFQQLISQIITNFGDLSYFLSMAQQFKFIL